MSRGVAGLPGLVVDVVAIVRWSVRTVQESHERTQHTMALDQSPTWAY